MKRRQVYPKLVFGPFRNLKWFLLVVTLGIYYVLPWIRWQRGAGVPDQAVLADFAGGKFYFFWLEIWPQEVYYITGLLILAAIGLIGGTLGLVAGYYGGRVDAPRRPEPSSNAESKKRECGMVVRVFWCHQRAAWARRRSRSRVSRLMAR